MMVQHRGTGRTARGLGIALALSLQLAVVGLIATFPGPSLAALPEVDCNGNQQPDGLDVPPLDFQAALAFVGGDQYLNDVTTADFDADGDVDVAVVVVPGFGAEVAVLRNDGDGRFAPPHTFEIPGHSQAIVALDYDGDDRPDLAASANTKIAFLRNLGTDFGAMQLVDVGGVVRDLAAADFDRDGDDDLVFSVHGGRTGILTRQPDGSWTNGPTFSAPSHGVTAADLNADEAVDLVFAFGLAVALNRGNGTFANLVSLPIELDILHLPTGLAVADLDGDDDSDLAIGIEEFGPFGRLQIALNNGNGTFVPGGAVSLAVEEVSAQLPSIALDAADVDGDEDIDLAIAANFTLVTEIYRNQGNATFPEHDSHVTGIATRVVLRDLDGDDDPDLGVASAQFVVVRNDAGAFRSAPFIKVPEGDRPGSGPLAVVSTDLDDDGDLDLATANRGAHSVSLLRNLGGRQWSAPVSHDLEEFPIALAAADFDLDRLPDLVALKEYGDEVVLLRNVNGLEFETKATWSLVRRGLGVATGRFGGTTGKDLLVASFNRMQVYLHQQGFEFAAPRLFDLDGQASDFALGDLDGDGTDEIAAVSNRQVAIVDVTAAAGEAVTTYEINEINTFLSQVAVTDVDGDHDMDVVAAAYDPLFGPASVVVLRNDGSGRLSAESSRPRAGGPVASGDVDRDGVSDLLIGTTLFRSEGPGVVLRGVRFASWRDLADALITDLDGDERPDIVFAHSGSGQTSSIDPGGVAILWNETAPATSRDCNLDRVPDECQVEQADCDGNAVPDDCQVDDDLDRVPDACDLCPDRDDLPDGDGDAVVDCLDGCPYDGGKTAPGLCGCGVPDADEDGDGLIHCLDNCPQIANADQENADLDEAGDACDGCPQHPWWYEPGACGCGVSAVDSDGDATPNCVDACPLHIGKTMPGACGCGLAEMPSDADGDTVLDCRDLCAGADDRLDGDADGVADCLDACPLDASTPAAALPLVYVLAVERNEVHVFDPHGRILRRIEVGKHPSALTTSPDGRWVAVVAEGDDSLAIIDTRSQSVMARASVGRRPFGVASSRDSKRFYVAHAEQAALAVYDLEARALATPIELPAPAYDVAVTLDGGTLLVASPAAGAVFVVDVESRAVRGSIEVAQPWALAVAGDGRAYASAYTGLARLQLDPPVATIVAPYFGIFELATTAARPFKVFAASFPEGMTIFDSADASVRHLPAANLGGGVGVSPDGRHVFFSAFGLGLRLSAPIGPRILATQDVAQSERIDLATNALYGAIEVLPHWPADVNDDAAISAADLIALGRRIGGGEASGRNDVGGDCAVDAEDLRSLACAVFGSSCASTGSSPVR